MQIVLSDLDVEPPVMGNCSTIASRSKHTRYRSNRPQHKFAKKAYDMLRLILNNAQWKHNLSALPFRHFRFLR